MKNEIKLFVVKAAALAVAMAISVQVGMAGWIALDRLLAVLR